MAGFLLRFLIFISTLWIVRRVLGALFGPGRTPTARQTGAPERGSAKDTVRDPVCGMYMDPRLAVQIDDGKGSVFFCSPECKEKYLSQPR